MGLANFTSGRHDADAGDDDKNTGAGLPPGLAGALMAASTVPGVGGADDLLDAMLVNYNVRHAGADAVLFRDELIEQVLSVLISKSKPNVLLVGSAGVGKTRIAEDIARRIAVGDLLIPDQLRKHTVYELPISSIVAGSGVVGQIEEKVKAVVDFASDPGNRVILFIDEIHQLTGGTGGARDSIYAKIAQILKPALARGDLSVIGATTTQEASSLDDDPAFARRFTRLVVDELTPEQTVTVLTKARPGLLAHYQYQVTVSDDVLEHVVTTADRQSRAGMHRPDNALTLLDRAMADRVLEQKRLITQAIARGDQMTASTLQALPNVPLTLNRVSSVAQRLLTGNAHKHQLDVDALRGALLGSLLGQDEILERLIDRLDRESLELFPRRTPIAWMFAGASGVGKTEAAKIIAEHLTGQPPIILNMTEFHHASAIARIIGAPAGYVGYESNSELPFDTLESNPHRVILLDEFEKSDVAVQRLFLSALDEGTIRTSRGKLLDFSKALIIATTNAAREALSKPSVGFNAEPRPQVSHRALNRVLAEHFDAELLGRFTLTVGFNPIDEATYAEVLASAYATARAAIIHDQPRLEPLLAHVVPDDDLVVLVKETYVASQGARPAARAVRAFIEDTLIAARHTASTAANLPDGEIGADSEVGECPAALA